MASKKVKKDRKVVKFFVSPPFLTVMAVLVSLGVFVPLLYSEAEKRYSLSTKSLLNDVLVESEKNFDAGRFEFAKQGLRDSLLAKPMQKFSSKNLMNPDLCRDVYAYFAKDPWVREVVSTTKRFPDSCVIELKLWKPVMYLKTDAGLRLVGCEPFDLSALSDGTRLKLVYLPSLVSKKQPGLEDLPLIRLGEKPRGDVGEVFTDLGLQTAAVFSEWLYLSGKSEFLPEINVTDLNHVLLSSSLGPVFDWGASPFVYEPPPKVSFQTRQQKLLILLPHLDRLDNSKPVPLYLEGLPYEKYADNTLVRSMQ